MRKLYLIFGFLFIHFINKAQSNPFKNDTNHYRMYDLYLNCLNDSCENLINDAVKIYDEVEEKTAIIDVPYYYILSAINVQQGNIDLGISLAEKCDSLITRYLNIKDNISFSKEDVRYYDKFIDFNTTKVKDWNDKTIGKMSVNDGNKSCSFCPVFVNSEPPPPSTLFTLDNQYFKECKTLANVNNHIIEALNDCGFEDQIKKYYYINGGFALVTPLEQLQDNATPLKNKDRWLYKPKAPRLFSLEYIKSFLFGLDGYFRIAVFLVTDEVLKNSGGQIAQNEALEWLNSGCNRLPKCREKLLFTSDHYCDVYIYEFEVTESKVTLLNPYKNPARVHLGNTDILDKLKP